MTTIKSFLGTSSTDRRSGIYVTGASALVVKLEGKVRIVNEAGGWTSPITGTYTTPGGQRVSATFVDPQFKAGRWNQGVHVLNSQGRDRTGNREDKIEIVVGAETKIGTEDVPVGRTGVVAHYSSAYAVGDISVVNRGEIYGYYRGIHVVHQGLSGDVSVETAKGSVTSKGILVYHSNHYALDKGGDVTITNHGTIKSLRQRPLYANMLTDGANGKVGTLLDSATAFSVHGIYVDHKDTTAPGSGEDSSSVIKITSSGDIAARQHGITIDTYGDADSIVPVMIDVTGGVIQAGDGDNGYQGHGIEVRHRRHLGGLIKVDLAGEIAQADERHGIHVYRYSATDARDGVNRDVEVTLKSGARIGMDGDEPTVSWDGVNVEQQADGGTVRVTVSEGAMIGTRETPVGENGVFAENDNHGSETYITLVNEGFIHARSSGLAAWHVGQGDVVVEHLKGEIVAGDAPKTFSANFSARTELAALKPRTAGLFAFHGGAEPQALPGKTLNGGDPSTYTTRIGKIKITSKADITSKGDGILAYVRDLDDTASRIAKMVIPVMIDVSGGTTTADGHGVYAETATTYTDTEAPMAGETIVTVGEMATIRAKKDGVHVKGMRTFASDHARKGQYDQTVTINGKVMGGGGDHAGVRMVNGGTLVIGPKAEIGATSGIAVSADKALHVTLKENAHGQIAFITGKFLNSGEDAPNVFQRESMAGMTKAIAVGDAVKATSGKTGTHGVYDAVFERMVTLKSITGGHQFEAGVEREISRTYHDRARVYEALPSVLLEMSGSDGRQARLSATRGGGGAWARALASDGEREADMSTTAMDTAGHDLSWDFERWGVETGFVVPTDAPGLMLGVSAHYRDGEADVERGGKIEVSGVGVGASATWRGEDGWYADGEFSYTRFEDVDLSSETRGMVASGLDGEGHAIGVEVGRRMEMDGFALIPRGGLTWTWVDVDGFADVSGITGSGRVSFRSEDSVRARVGALLENGQTYASLDVERDLSESREAMASGARLRSEAESTWARLGVGGVMTLDAQGESTLSADAHYAASDGDNHDYGASVLLKVRF